MMHRPRNRQPRGHHDQNTDPRHTQHHTSLNTSQRGRGSRGGPRIGTSRQTLSAVPTIQQVVPGARVSIVLKADQGTGREVQGIVQDVLTRGDHPRGIKVRTSDGRVGRVQRLSSSGVEETPQGSNTTSTSSTNAEVETPGYLGSEQRGLNLGDLLPISGDERVERERNEEDDGVMAGQDEAGVSVCPVCGKFKGDETAVAHHVSTHFE
ncbi:hypothetical protein EV356DRAFT_499593 [Viridothelium virens]|uniref:UBZ4-type domain-containing protein n=1 Tax=Viridothelium virens TaxID=1048519 RepID=A0A6A6HNL6_VIRVR|nr:hypothetical protein EV356DRAFT_499593 [Viridothelium virens]